MFTGNVSKFYLGHSATSNANAWVALGVAHYRRGKSEKVILVLERAINIEPDNDNSHRNLGGLLGSRRILRQIIRRPHQDVNEAVE